jgi:hypothetical protein
MEEFFTKVLNYSIKRCEKLLPLLIDFDLKHCIKTETFKNSIRGRKFAEHTGLEDAERIDSDPLYSISAERIIRLF